MGACDEWVRGRPGVNRGSQRGPADLRSQRFPKLPARDATPTEKGFPAEAGVGGGKREEGQLNS